MNSKSPTVSFKDVSIMVQGLRQTAGHLSETSEPHARTTDRPGEVKSTDRTLSCPYGVNRAVILETSEPSVVRAQGQAVVQKRETSEPPACYNSSLRLGVVRADYSTILTVKDFSVNIGETAFIKGAPSAGKTVLLKTIQRLPVIEDAAVKYPTQLKRKRPFAMYIGLEPAILTNRSVYDNVILTISRPTIRIRHRIIELLNSLGLDDKRVLKTALLSRSEQFRLQMVRAAILLPPVLLIDDLDLLAPRVDKETDKSISSIISLVCENAGSVIAAGNTATGLFDKLYEIKERTLSESQT